MVTDEHNNDVQREFGLISARLRPLLGGGSVSHPTCPLPRFNGWDWKSAFRTLWLHHLFLCFLLGSAKKKKKKKATAGGQMAKDRNTGPTFQALKLQVWPWTCGPGPGRTSGRSRTDCDSGFSTVAAGTSPCTPVAASGYNDWTYPFDASQPLCNILC